MNSKDRGQIYSHIDVSLVEIRSFAFLRCGLTMWPWHLQDVFEFNHRSRIIGIKSDLFCHFKHLNKCLLRYFTQTYRWMIDVFYGKEVYLIYVSTYYGAATEPHSVCCRKYQYWCTGCLYKLLPINLVWGTLKCSKSKFNPVHVFLHFKSFCQVL